jgi:hypothetical protein
MIQRKKALSEIVAYVILITIGLSLSTLVYVWLKGYVAETPTKTCPEGTTLIIKEYICNHTRSNNILLNLTIKNKGLFTVDGFLIKVNDRKDASIGIYNLYNSVAPKYGETIPPGEERSYQYSLKDDVYEGELKKIITNITLIEVQPFIDKTNKVFCESVSSQVTRC